ncbi:MAG TPA: M23 family metallopeptidase [Candidatus Omnitrophota bacterium]|nr:M23 family metallopeptidase [Candidatus Omnitrophota bacterium]
MQAPWPLKGKIIVTSEYGQRTKPRPGFHHGIDLVSDDHIIYANLNGFAHVGWDPDGFGRYVMLVGVTPQGTIFQAIYGHMVEDLHVQASQPPVQNGQCVTRGQPLGIMDSTGDSTGPHLHFEFRTYQNRAFQSIDPRKIIIPEMKLS